MNVKKKIAGELDRCYAVSPLRYNDEDHIIVAAEKVNKCMLFTLEGEYKETIWEEPGGTMSIAQIPGGDGAFLATQKFYSPNDSAEAKIVIVSPKGKNDWEIRTLAEVPFAHRFDIVERNGVHYLIACTIKNQHDYKDDWSHPGKVYAAVLPEDLGGYGEENQLDLEVIADGLTKNHGYSKYREDGYDHCVISAEEGVFLFDPPEKKDGSWTIEKLIDVPTSDAMYADFDGDGERELMTLAPFHGDDLSVYKRIDGSFKQVFHYEEDVAFLHSMWCGTLAGKTRAVVGCRKGNRNLMVLTYNSEKDTYDVDVIDADCGSANVCHYVKDGVDYIVSTNREINEIAFYRIEEEA